MSSRVRIRTLLFTIWFLGVAAAFTLTGIQAQDDKDEFARRVREILRGRCFQCHGQNGVARNNVFVLDYARLMSSKTVIPGNTGSLLLKVVESDTMPLGGPPLPRDEKSTLRSWVLGGAADWNSQLVRSQARTLVTAVTAMIRDDLTRAGERTRPFLRYFSIAHLYNAGAPEDELESHRAALAKLINSLSWHRDITQPVPIDPAKTLFRIDLRDYEWTAAKWSHILAAYPYGIRTADSEQIGRLSGADLPYVRADWFLANASVPPLYHELLDLPRTVSELERLLGAETTPGSPAENDVVRAGVRNSGVSQNNRVRRLLEELRLLKQPGQSEHLQRSASPEPRRGRDHLQSSERPAGVLPRERPGPAN
jgi:mono/diheme cytochrome c family protein